MSQLPVSTTLDGQSGAPRKFGPKRILGLAASIVAIATSVVSCQMKQAELQAKQAEFQFKEQEFSALKQTQADEAKARADNAQKEYLASLAAADRLSQARILRFIVAVETNERLRAWADGELERLDKTVQKETAEAEQSVENLTEEASSKKGVKAEEAQLALAVRSVDLARLKLAQSAINVGTGDAPQNSTPTPEHQTTKAECFAHCAPEARQCEAACNGDRACMKSRCFPQEAGCREECMKGPPPG